MIKTEWYLVFENKTVASLISKKRLFTSNREGCYNSTNVLIKYNKKEDVSYFHKSGTDEIIGTLDNIQKLSRQDHKVNIIGTFRYYNGSIFTVTAENEGYYFRNEKGDDIAVTNYNAWITPTTSSFTLLLGDLAIDPWLIALVSHYYAINIASGMI